MPEEVTEVLTVEELVAMLRASASTVTEVLTVEELAGEMKVPIATVYRWNYAGTGPRAIKVGRFVRYRRSDVEHWLDERTVKASA